MTKHISLIIDQEYESGLSLRKSGSAYLTPLESTDGLNYDANTGKLILKEYLYQKQNWKKLVVVRLLKSVNLICPY